MNALIKINLFLGISRACLFSDGGCAEIAGALALKNIARAARAESKKN